jgi:hypothetical protein
MEQAMYHPGYDVYQILKTILSVLKQFFEEQKRIATLAQERYTKTPSRHQPIDPLHNTELFIRPYQAATILNIHPRSADRKLREIRLAYNIPPRHPVTLREFCRYTRLPIPDVLQKLTP